MTYVKTAFDAMTGVTLFVRRLLTGVMTCRTMRDVSYRPPSRTPIGAWANHLHAQRRDRKLSQTQAFELVYKGLKLSPKSRAVYVALDMGDRQPTAAEAEYLASVFGWPPKGVAAPLGATESDDPLIRALTAQTEALTALAGQVKALVEAQIAPMELAHALAGAVGLAVREALQAGSRDDAPLRR